MAVVYDIFNLGILSLVLTLISYLGYYTNSENVFYIWVFSLTPKEFLRFKLKNIIFNSTILTFPIILSLSIFYYNRIDIILGFQFLGLSKILNIFFENHLMSLFLKSLYTFEWYK